MEFLISNGIVALVFLLGGAITFIFPPKKINHLYGYRTERSMKNIETWKAANRFASKIMMLASVDLFLIGLILYWADVKNENIWAAVTIVSVILVAVIIYLLTENYLKEKFDEEGKPID